MIIYNITCKVDWDVHTQWYEWVREQYIPQMVESGLFRQGQLVKLLDLDESEGPTYAIQFSGVSLGDYRLYMSDPALAGLRNAQNRWADAVVSFGSVMQVME